MCGWERTTYACGHVSELQKMPYSCDQYRRHVYGPCRYSERHDRDRVVEVYSEDYCGAAECMFGYVAY